MKSIQDFLDEYRDKLRGDRHSQEAVVDLKPGVVIQNPEGQEGLDSESDFSSDQLSQDLASPPPSEVSCSSKKAPFGLDDVLSDSLPHHLGAVRSKLGHAFQKIEEVYQQQITRLGHLQDQLRGVQSEIEKVHKIRVTADTLVRLLKLATQKKRVVDSLDERRVSLDKEVKALQQKHQQDETSWRDFVFEFQKKKERYEQEEQLLKHRLIEKKHQYQVDYDQRYKDLDMELEKRRSECETELIQKQAEQERANHEKHLRFEEECKNKLELFTEHQRELEEKISYQKNYFSEKEKLLHDRHRDFSQLESKLSGMKQDIQVHLKEKEKEVTDRLVTRYDHMMANTKSQYEQELSALKDNIKTFESELVAKEVALKASKALLDRQEIDRVSQVQDTHHVTQSVSDTDSSVIPRISPSESSFDLDALEDFPRRKPLETVIRKKAPRILRALGMR